MYIEFIVLGLTLLSSGHFACVGETLDSYTTIELDPSMLFAVPKTIGGVFDGSIVFANLTRIIFVPEPVASYQYIPWGLRSYWDLPPDTSCIISSLAVNLDSIVYACTTSPGVGELGILGCNGTNNDTGKCDSLFLKHTLRRTDVPIDIAPTEVDFEFVDIDIGGHSAAFSFADHVALMDLDSFEITDTIRFKGDNNDIKSIYYGQTEHKVNHVACTMFSTYSNTDWSVITTNQVIDGKFRNDTGDRLSRAINSRANPLLRTFAFSTEVFYDIGVEYSRLAVPGYSYINIYNFGLSAAREVRTPITIVNCALFESLLSYAKADTAAPAAESDPSFSSTCLVYLTSNTTMELISWTSGLQFTETLLSSRYYFADPKLTLYWIAASPQYFITYSPFQRASSFAEPHGIVVVAPQPAGTQTCATGKDLMCSVYPFAPSYIECWPGYYKPLPDASPCLPCPVGTYWVNSTACTPCASGSYCPFATIEPLTADVRKALGSGRGTNFTFPLTSAESTMQSRLVKALFLPATPFFWVVIVSLSTLLLIGALTFVLWLRRHDTRAVRYISKLDFFRLAVYDKRGRTISIVRSVLGALITVFAATLVVVSVAFMLIFYHGYRPIPVASSATFIPEESPNSVRTVTVTSIGDTATEKDPIIIATQKYTATTIELQLLDFTPQELCTTQTVLLSNRAEISNCFDEETETCHADFVAAMTTSASLGNISVCSITTRFPSPHALIGRAGITIPVVFPRAHFTGALLTVSASNCTDPIGVCSDLVASDYVQPILLSDKKLHYAVGGEYAISLKATIVLRESELQSNPTNFHTTPYISFSSSQLLTAPGMNQPLLSMIYPTDFYVHIIIEPNAFWIRERETRVVQLVDTGVTVVLMMISMYSVLVIVTKSEKKIVAFLQSRCCRKKLNNNEENYRLLLDPGAVSELSTNA